MKPRFLLDTHILLRWLAEPKRLSREHRRILRETVRRHEPVAIEILPITTEVAAQVGAIGPSLRDPADRAIVSTARLHRLLLLTADQRILNSNFVPTI